MSTLMKYKGFIGSCGVSLENNTLYGKIEDIYDLISYEAETQQDLQQAFEQAVEDYLKSCQLRGRNR